PIAAGGAAAWIGSAAATDSGSEPEPFTPLPLPLANWAASPGVGPTTGGTVSSPSSSPGRVLVATPWSSNPGIMIATPSVDTRNDAQTPLPWRRDSTWLVVSQSVLVVTMAGSFAMGPVVDTKRLSGVERTERSAT